MSEELARVGWVVDVQNDFMEPTGRLYVHNLFDAADPGATLAEKPIERTVCWMREHCDAIVFTGDWHAAGDREIDPVSPDATKGTYPPHCMGASPNEEEHRGALVVASIAPDNAIILERDASPERGREVARAAVREHRPVFIQKKEFSVFDGNPATDAFVVTLVAELKRPVEFVVCGVATDVCVKHAVDGFLDRSRVVRIVPDATWGLGLESPSEMFRQWRTRGAVLTTVDELDSLTTKRG